VRSNFHLSLDPEKVKKMAIDAGFTRTQAWYSVRHCVPTLAILPAALARVPHNGVCVCGHQVVPIEAFNTAEVMEKYTASATVRQSRCRCVAWPWSLQCVTRAD
jgi:hypothetical protein